MAIGNRRAVCAVRSVTAADDLQIPVTLYADGAAYSAAGQIVKAAVTDGRGRQLIAATDQSSTASGANWANGVIVVEFTASQAMNIVRGSIFIEVQVVASGKKYSWPLIPIEVEQGVIP